MLNPWPRIGDDTPARRGVMAGVYWSHYVCTLWSGEGWQLLLWLRFPPTIKRTRWPSPPGPLIFSGWIIGPVTYRRWAPPAGR